MSGPDSAAVQRERASLIDRLMGLSDGLFAIAMTLLIPNIEVPDLPEGQADELAGETWRPSIPRSTSGCSASRCSHYSGEPNTWRSIG